ncbi:MAG: dihydrolipoamide acetyltransferase family protein [bacterium]
MATLIEMPKLSDTMTTGKILSWLKHEGDAVPAGTAIAEVETDKATMELEVFEDGTLLKILAPVESAVPIGGALAIIGKPGEDIQGLIEKAGSTAAGAPAATPPAKAEAPQPAAAPESQPAPVAAAEEAAAPAEAESGRIKISPVAQRMAVEHGVDLRRVKGSGPGGRIVKADIERALETAPAAAPRPAPASAPAMSGVPAAAAYTDAPLSSIRAVIAERLPQSLGPVPHFFLEMDLDAEPLLELKQQLQALAGEDLRLTVTDILIKACANALRQHPEINSSFLGNAVRQYHNVNVGIAVAGKGTLLVPVIRACESKAIGQIARERAVLVEKGQAGKLSPEELSGGTFTISNLGMLGITRFTAVINPPQAAILAVGTIREEPVVKNGQVVPGQRMAVTLSCDHRAFDGAEGARFMATLKLKLENPLAISL